MARDLGGKPTDAIWIVTLVELVGGMPVGGTTEFFGDLMKRQRAARGPLLTELGLIGK